MALMLSAISGLIQPLSAADGQVLVPQIDRAAVAISLTIKYVTNPMLNAYFIKDREERRRIVQQHWIDRYVDALPNTIRHTVCGWRACVAENPERQRPQIKAFHASQSVGR